MKNYTVSYKNFIRERSIATFVHLLIDIINVLIIFLILLNNSKHIFQLLNLKKFSFQRFLKILVIQNSFSVQARDTSCKFFGGFIFTTLH